MQVEWTTLVKLETKLETYFSWVHTRVHAEHIKTYKQSRLYKYTMRWQRYQAQDKFEEYSPVLVGAPLITLQIQY